MPRYGITSGGRMKRYAAGAIAPSSDGPSNTPPTTSPMTGGCPIAANQRPSNWPTTTTAVSATSRCRRTFCAAEVETEVVIRVTSGAGAERVPPMRRTSRTITTAPSTMAT
jgi:hypothetical protein